MNRKMQRPVIDIRRIPTGEKPLEELAAEVYLWIFEGNPAVKSSGSTFVNCKKTRYNGSVKMISGGNDHDTAA